MICFLTSSQDQPGEMHLNRANGFAEEFMRVAPQPCRCVYICSAPDDYESTDKYGGLMREILEGTGVELASYDVLDGRNRQDAAQLIAGADVLVLTGGHVPTQNRFFHEIGLRELLQGYDGIVIGISAGTMNCAEIVYAQPEEPGEAADPAYEKFLPGLGLTEMMLVPHYQMTKDYELDGMRLYEDITFGDSYGKRIFVLVDGSYLYIHDGVEELRGEAYLVQDGAMRQIAAEGDVIVDPLSEDFSEM